MKELKTKVLHNLEELKEHLLSHVPTLYVSSRTSTVIDYENLEMGYQKSFENALKREFVLGDLSELPATIEINEFGNLVISGAVSWKKAREYVRNQKRDIKTAPTEELALVLAGVATSCTGERCFGFGNLRGQVVSLKFLDFAGKEHKLIRQNILENNTFLKWTKDELKVLKLYQDDQKDYINFKNAPYPILNNETDLLIGTEGQLGVVTEVELETVPYMNIRYFFLLLPPWENDFRPHLEIYEKVQSLRGKILAVELVDSHGMSFLKDEDRLGNDEDVIFMEIQEEDLETVHANIFEKLKNISIQKIFEIKETRYHHIRASVPRAIFEENAKQKVVKKGTDVQVKSENFPDLIKFYLEGTKLGIKYCLFGHFGDAHLHFNFLPESDQELEQKIEKYFLKLYEKVLLWKGSPFAEHGIGLLKQNYIRPYHKKKQKELFLILKKKLDPHLQFFPQGFMRTSS